MANITKQQKQDIRTLVRRANRRIERTMEGIKSAGQKSALEYFVRKYTGGDKWSAATKGMTFEQAAQRINQLETFLAAQSTTKTGWVVDPSTGKGSHTGEGWRGMKAKNVSAANETLTQMGYDFEDEELAEILTQIDTADKKEFYRAINLVQAAKTDAGDAWKASRKQIREALEDKLSYQQAFEKAIDARENK